MYIKGIDHTQYTPPQPPSGLSVAHHRDMTLPFPRVKNTISGKFFVSCCQFTLKKKKTVQTKNCQFSSVQHIFGHYGRISLSWNYLTLSDFIKFQGIFLRSTYIVFIKMFTKTNKNLVFFKHKKDWKGLRWNLGLTDFFAILPGLG